MSYCEEVTPCHEPSVDREELFAILMQRIGFGAFRMAWIEKGNVVLRADVNVEALCPRKHRKKFYRYMAELILAKDCMPAVNEDMKAYVTRRREEITYRCEGTIKVVRM